MGQYKLEIVYVLPNTIKISYIKNFRLTVSIFKIKIRIGLMECAKGFKVFEK